MTALSGGWAGRTSAGASSSAVRIGIAEEQIARLGGLELRAGMPAEVFINTGERTALSYLMKPSSDAIRRALREG